MLTLRSSAARIQKRAALQTSIRWKAERGMKTPMISHDEAQKRMSYKFGPKAGFDWQWLENMNEEFDDKKKIYRAGVRTQPIQRIKRFVPEMKWDLDQMYDKCKPKVEKERGDRGANRFDWKQ